MRKSWCAYLTFMATCAFAAEGPVPFGVPHLDHVWVIMMENHGYGQVVGNPNMSYVNDLIGVTNTATNYFAIAHPSLVDIEGGFNSN
jgi:phosphatidylinositol-3-phosphatase